MNNNINYLKNLLPERNILDLKNLPEIKKITKISSELTSNSNDVSKIICITRDELITKIGITFKENLSFRDLTIEFGKPSIHYSPRDNVSTVHFDNLVSTAAKLEFVINDRLEKTGANNYQTIDPQGRITLDATECPLKVLSIKYN